jgi:hypothetical protein
MVIFNKIVEDRSNIDFVLKLNGFQVIHIRESENFGHYLMIYSNQYITLRIISDRSMISVDVRRYGGAEWFDINLVKVLLLNDAVSISPLDSTELKTFLSNHLKNIISLFDTINYSSTEEKLRHLEKIRAKKMFPGTDLL